MIAVLAKPGELPVVREFFELFKTPWSFFDGSPATVVICSGTAVPPTDAKLVLIYDGKLNDFDRRHEIPIRPADAGKAFAHQDLRFPIYGNCLVAPDSGEVAIRKIVSHGQTFVRIGYDLFDEIRHLLTWGQPAAQAGVPTLELHIALLRDLILECSIPLIEIPPVPDGSRFIACLTHDVDHVGIRNHKFDHTMFGFLYRATVGSVLDLCRGKKNTRQLAVNWLAALKLPLVHFGLARDFWLQFDRYLEMEKGLSSTFFIIPHKGEPGMDSRGKRPARRAASYDAAGLIEPLQKLQSAGDEIGVHGIDAWRDIAAGRLEREIISRLNHGAEIGVRMHWLFFDEHSPAVLEAAGFSYDSTVGYNETVGYRAGTVQVFKPASAERLLELPMHLMDTALFYPCYLNLSPRAAEKTVRPLVANAARFGGVLTVNWHDRSVAPERLWDTAYSRLLEQLRARGAVFLTAVRAVAWFRQRRAVTFEWSAGTVKVKAPAASDASLPGLLVRHYPPDGGGKFVETRLSAAGEVCLAA